MKNQLESKTQQLGLFNPIKTAEYSITPLPQQSLTIGPEALKSVFLDTYQKVRVFTQSSPIKVEVPASKALIQMAAAQRLEQKNTRRARTDCDLIALLGRIAVGKYLGEGGNEIFSRWNSALQKGDKGAKWILPPEFVGLRTATGGKCYTLSNNPHANRLTALAFCRVDLQHSGTAWCSLEGWAMRSDLWGHVKNLGNYSVIESEFFQSSGLVFPMASFKAAYQRGWF